MTTNDHPYSARLLFVRRRGRLLTKTTIQRSAPRKVHRGHGRRPCLSRCLGLLLSHSPLLCDHVFLNCPRIAARFAPCGSLWPIPSHLDLTDAPCLRPPGSAVDDPLKILPYAARSRCFARSPPNLPLRLPAMHHFLRRASRPRKARSSQCLRPLLRSPHASKTTLSTQHQLFARRPVLIGPCLWPCY
ncbi:hypothetical protein B0J12DRAFT_413223 [Macrophomina phaseolina]|uniref:Uncharacterized protein n=1 Tax=Macrophomina phaseolina TaxID=35725 RepID=A0ABQ8GJD3_9PEZI|nr:hypothetical protein B0J12DRAFT_413223 [Macrophomina phaseolina]